MTDPDLASERPPLRRTEEAESIDVAGGAGVADEPLAGFRARLQTESR